MLEVTSLVLEYVTKDLCTKIKFLSYLRLTHLKKFIILSNNLFLSLYLKTIYLDLSTT